MQLILYINNNEIWVNHYEGFKKKAVMTIPTNQNLSFSKILSLLEESDLSEMIFFHRDNQHDLLEIQEEIDGKLVDYTKLVSFNNNMESNLATFIFEKVSNEENQITNLELALCDLFERNGGTQ